MDYDEDGEVELGDDLTAINDVVLNIVPPSPASDRFGWISWSWQQENLALTSFDRILAIKMHLGIIPPCP